MYVYIYIYTYIRVVRAFTRAGSIRESETKEIAPWVAAARYQLADSSTELGYWLPAPSPRGLRTYIQLRRRQRSALWHSISARQRASYLENSRGAARSPVRDMNSRSLARSLPFIFHACLPSILLARGPLPARARLSASAISATTVCVGLSLTSPLSLSPSCSPFERVPLSLSLSLACSEPRLLFCARPVCVPVLFQPRLPFSLFFFFFLYTLLCSAFAHSLSLSLLSLFPLWDPCVSSSSSNFLCRAPRAPPHTTRMRVYEVSRGGDAIFLLLLLLPPLRGIHKYKRGRMVAVFEARACARDEACAAHVGGFIELAPRVLSLRENLSCGRKDARFRLISRFKGARLCV